MLQLFDNKYPYTDFHELNLDWIISKVIKLDFDLKNFVSLNTIKYASPIDWNITTQYETNTVVLDDYVAYLSTQPVPKGVDISNRDYWLPIADFGGVIDYSEFIRDQIAASHEYAYVATRNYVAGEWLFIKDSNNYDLLYITTDTILSGTGLVDGTNIDKVTVEEIVKAYFSSIVGELSNLTTTNKNNVVSAINELDSDFNAIDARVGSLSDLNTSDRTSIVNAINSVNTAVAQINPTYINVKTYGAVGDGVTDDTAAINAAKAVAESTEGGATLYFPAGTYLISSTLTFTYKPNYNLGGVSIKGDGQYSSRIKANADIDLISYVGDDTIPNGNGHLFGIVISDIYLWYDNNNSTHRGIQFIHCRNVNMARVRIRYFQCAVFLSDCANSIFYGVGISANVLNARGFDVGDRSVSNYYIGCFFAASGAAVGLSAGSAGFWADRGIIADQNITYFDVGGLPQEAIHLNGINNTAQQAGDINIIDLVCESYYGIAAYNITTHGNMNIIGGWFNCKSGSDARSGIYLTNVQGCNVTGSIFVNNVGAVDVGPKKAITLMSGCRYIKVSNCLIRDQVALDSSINGTSSYIQFINNMIIMTGSCQNTLVYLTAVHSLALGNSFAGSGSIPRYILLDASANYSIMAFNVGDHRNTGAAGFADNSTGSIVANNQNNTYP